VVGVGCGRRWQTFNQATRWVNTKEEHCSKIITLVGEYCLCQRIKPLSDPKTPFKAEDEFVEALKAHHAVMTAAMKAKQSTDPATTTALAYARRRLPAWTAPVPPGLT
jgi:hypothetical protein